MICKDKFILRQVELSNNDTKKVNNCVKCKGKGVIFHPAYNSQFKYWYVLGVRCECWQNKTDGKR